jgi:hypothetical protein
MSSATWPWLSVAAAIGVTVAAMWFVQDRRERYRFSIAPTVPSPIPFEKAGWASGSATLRHGMARQMIADGELVGLSRAEIVDRLGQPSEKHGDTLHWYLGQREDPTGYMWNYEEYLVVSFDARPNCQTAIIIGRD